MRCPIPLRCVLCLCLQMWMCVEPSQSNTYILDAIQRNAPTLVHADEHTLQVRWSWLLIHNTRPARKKRQRSVSPKVTVLEKYWFRSYINSLWVARVLAMWGRKKAPWKTSAQYYNPTPCSRVCDRERERERATGVGTSAAASVQATLSHSRSPLAHVGLNTNIRTALSTFLQGSCSFPTDRQSNSNSLTSEGDSPSHCSVPVTWSFKKKNPASGRRRSLLAN